MGLTAYLKKSMADFLKSFKASRLFHFVVLIDMVFYGIIAAVMLIIVPVYFLDRFSSFYTSLMMYSQVPSEFAGDAVSGLTSEGFHLFLWIIGLFIIIVLSFSFFKGLIWKIVTSGKLSKKTVAEFIKKNLARFVLMEIILSLIIILLFYISYAALKTDAFSMFVLFILIPISVHVYLVFQPVLIINRVFWNSFRKTLGIAFGRIYLFILPYVLMAAVLAILFILISLVSNLPRTLSGILTLLLFVLFFNWSKYYLARVIGPLVR